MCSGLVLETRRTQTRVGNEVARNQLASRQPRTSPLCLDQSHPFFVHTRPSLPGLTQRRFAVQTRSSVPLFLRGLVGCYLNFFFVLIIILRHIITETNKNHCK
ncbi:uncharacterized protein LOC143428043 [Xylocopa sonorina]|uniref:uncharacterized protein LOC143428043 n=1 Tax=Xylocopa sonorina TaxID=1818115 RepID=UPI00403A98D5